VPPRPFTGMVLLFLSVEIFIPHRKYTYLSPQSVMEIVLLRLD
jgi:hypothetical protein